MFLKCIGFSGLSIDTYTLHILPVLQYYNIEASFLFTRLHYIFIYVCVCIIIYIIYTNVYIYIYLHAYIHRYNRRTQ